VQEYDFEHWQVSSRTVVVLNRVSPALIGPVRIELEVMSVDDRLESLRQALLLSEVSERLPVVDSALFDVLTAATRDYFVRRYGAQGSWQDLRPALRELPVPVFGSPPASWETLERLVNSVGPFGTAVLLAHEVGGGISLPSLVLFGAGMTVAVNILQPTTRAFGDVIADRIRRWGPADKDRETK
jgi:hypothetical protein